MNLPLTMKHIAAEGPDGAKSGAPEILKLVVQGLTNREIGERLHLSEKTIKHYITNILEKLHVRSRMEAAMLAVRSARREPDNR